MRKKFILFNFLIIALALAALFAFGVSASRESHFNEAEKKIDEITRIYVNNYSDEIKNNLKEKYWPNAINFEESLPRTQVGKVDYKKLDNDTKMIFEKYNGDEKLKIIDNYPKNLSLKLKKHV